MLENREKEIVRGIEKLYFNRNFGSASKTDIEVFMFHQYMESLRTKGEDRTNYQISKELGITVQKVVALKEREASKYPYDSSQWRRVLLENMRYLELEGNEFSLLITDRRLYREVESFLEENKISVKYVRNSNTFIAGFDLLMELFDQLFEDQNLEYVKETKDNLLDRQSITLDELRRSSGEKALSYLRDLSIALLSLLL